MNRRPILMSLGEKNCQKFFSQGVCMAVKLKLLGSIQQIITLFHDICSSTVFFSWRFKKDFFPERYFSTFGLKKKTFAYLWNKALAFFKKAQIQGQLYLLAENYSSWKLKHLLRCHVLVDLFP